ncbi:STAS domain-containing protein [Streptosporangium sp. NPDC023615]|uniref:STAS domain-containing protein n=1 Tax=Streptosporangium sp. NPDC023615 TaxID=3154794 RepID=UPI0034421C0F
MDGIGGIGRTPARNGGTCGVLRITPTIHPPGMRLEGELDHGGVPAVTVALAAVVRRAARGDGSFHVDLSGLDFVDVGGLRLLVDAGPGPGGADVMRVVAISAAVDRLLRLTGWGTLPGWDQAPVAVRARSGAGGHRPPAAATNAGAADGGG